MISSTVVELTMQIYVLWLGGKQLYLTEEVGGDSSHIFRKGLIAWIVRILTCPTSKPTLIELNSFSRSNTKATSTAK